jgi:PAS domain S-box-containing protein
VIRAPVFLLRFLRIPLRKIIQEDSVMEEIEILRQSEQRWRAIVENAAIGIVVIDPRGHIQAANAAYRRMLAYSMNELQGVTVLDLTAEEDRTTVQVGLAALLGGAQQGVTFKQRSCRRDGSLIWLDVNASVLQNAANGPESVLLTVEDITAHKHTADVRTQGAITATIAHEISQPLTAIVANADACSRWLAFAPPELEEARACVNRIANEGTRAGEVVRRMRSLFKKGIPQIARLDINEVVRDVLTLAGHEIANECISTRVELQTDLPAVMGDRIQLQEVLLNLVMNAVEAIHASESKPRELFIAAKTHEADRVLVSVRDSGVGIDPGNQEAMFAPFFTTKSQGMGIGLAISRSIVEAHGGRLWSMPNEDKGATFVFALPAAS